MKVFLVVISIWAMAYRGNQATPAMVQEMPSIKACEMVAASIVRMTDDKNYGPAKVECVLVQEPQGTGR